MKLTIDDARAEQTAKGWAADAVRKMAGPIPSKPPCGLLRLESRSLAYAYWRCACGDELQVVGGLDEAYLDYHAHRQQHDYWRTHVDALEVQS